MGNVEVAPFAMPELLERAGARIISGQRANCPKCNRRRAISFTAETFFCHGADCGWKGNTFTLGRELGLTKMLSGAEARALRQERELSDAATRAFLVRVRSERQRLCARDAELLRLRNQAHEHLKENSSNETALSALAFVYRNLPAVRAELALLSEGTIGDRVTWFQASEKTRCEMVDRILQNGGVPTFDGKWAEVNFGD